MTALNSPIGYQTWLQSELAQRIGRNPHYSIRAFSKHLGVDHSMLVRVLSGKRHLSIEKAEQIGGLLFGSATAQSRRFVDLVELAKSRSPDSKARVLERLDLHANQEFGISFKDEIIHLDHFAYIAEWYHVVLLHLVGQVSPWDHKLAAKQLGISPTEVKNAIERLLRLRLIASTSLGGFRKTKTRLIVRSKDSNQALQRFNTQMLEHAIHHIRTGPNTERRMGSETLNLREQDLSEVESIMEQAFQKVISLSKRAAGKGTVYHFQSIVFPIVKVDEKKAVKGQESL